MANQATFKETDFSVGDTVSIHHKIKEAKKERIQLFTGLVIAIRGEGSNKSFIVRKIATGGVGVERIWPLFCPSISKIEVKRRGKVRRAKLYYLRKRVGKKALQVKKLDEKKKKQTIRAKKKTHSKVGNKKKEVGKTGRKTSKKTSSK